MVFATEVKETLRELRLKSLKFNFRGISVMVRDRIEIQIIWITAYLKQSDKDQDI